MQLLELLNVLIWKIEQGVSLRACRRSEPRHFSVTLGKRRQNKLFHFLVMLVNSAPFLVATQGRQFLATFLIKFLLNTKPNFHNPSKQINKKPKPLFVALKKPWLISSKSLTSKVGELKQGMPLTHFAKKRFPLPANNKTLIAKALIFVVNTKSRLAIFAALSLNV